MVSGSIIEMPAAGAGTVRRSAGSEVVFSGVRADYCARGVSRTVLEKLDLRVQPGEFVCLLGRTGCGKSTMLKLVLGELRPATGTVLVDSQAVDGPGDHCGYVPQKYSLFPDRRVLQNVTFGPLTRKRHPARREIRNRALELLARMGLSAADARKFPHELSGGMQQRVAIAQALATEPGLLLMDEAFSALDGVTRSSMQELLREVWIERGATLLFVTHSISEAALLASRLIVLSKPQDAAEHHPARIALDIKSPWQAAVPIEHRKRSREYHELISSLESVTRGETAVQTAEKAVHG